MSLLTDDEAADLELDDEERLCRAAEMDFISVPIFDRAVPASIQSFRGELVEIAKRLDRGSGVLIHCRQGIGRAALATICLIVLAGIDVDTSIARVTAARGCAVPETPEQRGWIYEFARETRNDSLGRS